MKLTIADLIDAEPALSRLLQKPANAAMINGHAAYRIQKNLRLIGQELRDLENVNAALIKKHGKEKKNDAGNPDGYSVDRFDLKAMRAYQKEYRQAVAEEVEINLLKFPDGLLDQVGLTIGDRVALWFFLDDAPAIDSNHREKEAVKA